MAKRAREAVVSTDFEDLSPALQFIGYRIDKENKTVHTSLFGLGAVSAIYREGLGCTLAIDGPPANMPSRSVLSGAILYTDKITPPSVGETSPQKNRETLNLILDEAMQDSVAKHRSFVVMVDGEIIVERYAEGFTKDTPFLSWSMAKSVTATLIGVLASQGDLTISDPAPVPEWVDDDRAAISWRDLLRMESGLAFEEIYESTDSDVNRMLFTSREMARVAANKSAIHKPGAHFSYSSGTSNILTRTLNDVLMEKGSNLQRFARDAVFDRIGAKSFVLETDASGNFIGSSYVYATARDWARLGQLYLQNGEWEGVQILSPEWVSFVQEPTEASDHSYGGHFWLNYDGPSGRERWLKGLPEDVYSMSGHEGQYVFIFPSHNIVIVRTGMTRGQSASEVVSPIIKALAEAAIAPRGL